ncbi:hypothetical protein PS6_009477 [Mucor atramentarius]
MSVITSPNVFKRVSLHLPAKVNSVNPSLGNNSTCPLPLNDRQPKRKDSQFKVSHDITMLYELFSSLVSPKPNHRQHETSHNKTTSALFYDSHHVKKYMQHVMTRKNMTNIINYGFPCPHIVLESADLPMLQYHCEHCEFREKQETIRLTLTPTHCRADDDEIYKNAHTTTPHLEQQQSKRMKKRMGCIFLFIS